MALRTFTGSTMQEVMAKVKAEIGDEALIVSNRAIKKPTLTTPGLYEIVVQVEDDEKKEIKTSLKNNKKNSFDNDVMLKLSQAAKEINSLSEKSIKLDNNPTSVSTPNIVEIKELQKEIKEIANHMKLLQATVWDLNAPKRDNLVIPPEFSEIYAIAKNSGMNKNHLDEIMELTLKHMPLKMRKNPILIKRYFNTLLKKMIPIRLEKDLRAGMKKIMMFVGPTGVGKTTTLAKLAARYAFKKEKKYKVGIITLDTYRIGAVEQLMRYARMMKLSIEAVVDPDDFSEALNKLKHNDIILIDTVGSSQHDKEKVDRLNRFANINTFASIDVNLVMSANTKYEDLKDIYKNFSILDIDTFIFTKLDETLKIGNIFSLIYEVKKPLSYLSIGQEVPDDLMVADSNYLVENILKDVE
ncbi:MAG: flagellar biosynthesis protein FlhF [Nautilia sp.]|nr:MAG: flagellar biosynthesis protein FlhF [Nautilia sp.]